MPAAFRPTRLPSYDEESIVAEIKRVVNGHFGGTAPRKDEFDKFSMVKSWAIRRRLGSWANAVRKAGFSYYGKNYEGKSLSRANYSRDLMISDLQRVKDLNRGQYFSQDFYKANGGLYSVKTLKKHLASSWESLLREHLMLERPLTLRLKVHHAGVKRVSRYNEQELILELGRVWDIIGRRPTYPEFKRLGRIGVKVYERHFGSWKAAIAHFYAQFGAYTIGRSRCHATHDLLLAELKRLACLTGTRLTFETYRRLGGSYSIGTFQKYFGTWQAAVGRIGRQDGHFSKHSDDELFSELQRVWEASGRQPTFQEMSRNGRISGKVYQHRFGSWMKAICAFCADRQSLQEEGIAAVPASSIDVESAPPPATVEESILPPEVRVSAAGATFVDARRTPGKRLRFRVLQRDRFRCVLCGRSPQLHGVVLQVDHIKAWSQGGLTVLDNLQATCEDCNGGKSNVSTG